MLHCAAYLTHDHILHSQIAEMEPLFWHSDEKQAAAAAAAAAAIDHLFSDSFRMFEFKVKRCMRGRSHDWTECPYAHPGEKARRRDPRRFHYSGTACPDYRKGSCKRGDACEYAHGVFESWLHPARYRTQLCKDGRSCVRRVCFFAHTPEQLRILPSSETAAAAATATTTTTVTSDFPAVATVMAPNVLNTTTSHSNDPNLLNPTTSYPNDHKTTSYSNDPNVLNTSTSYSNDPAAAHPTDASDAASPIAASVLARGQPHFLSYDQFPSHPSQEDPLRHNFPSAPHFPFLSTPSSHGHACSNVLIPSPRSTLQAHSVFSPTPRSPLTSPSTSPPSSPNNFSNPAARRNSFPSSSSSSTIKGNPSASFSQMLCSFDESVCGNMLLDTHPHHRQQQGLSQSSQIHPLDRHNSVVLQSNAGSYSSGEEARHALSGMEDLISLLKQVEMAGGQEPTGQAPTQTKVQHGNAAIAIPTAGVIGSQKSKSEPPYLGCYARNLYAAKPTWHSNGVGVGLSWCLTPSDQSEPVVLERVESGRGLRAQIFESLIKSSEITCKEGP